MSRSLLRGLDILSAIDRGAAGINEVAREVGLDKSVVSRTVTAMLDTGWLERASDRLELGPRAILLGAGSRGRSLVTRARSLVSTLAGVTGFHAVAVQLAGSTAFVIATAAGDDPTPELPSELEATPLWASASGWCIAAQLEDALLDALLPTDRFPAMTQSSITTRTELDDRIRRVRAGEVAIEQGQYDPAYECRALPWDPGTATSPLSLAVIAPLGSLEGSAEALAIGSLRAAVEPGATRPSVLAAVADR